MRLATFIETAQVQILAEAIAFAKTIPALQHTSEKALRDHLPEVLEAISADLRTSQTRAASILKSHGKATPGTSQTSAQTHGLTRAQDGINIEQLIAEFRALRSSILRLWAEAYPVGPDAFEDITRFNEAIDQAVAESVKVHADERERWRQIFLGIVGHDLRGPLHTISLTAALMRQQGSAPVQQTALLTRGIERMTGLLNTLLEYSRSNLGGDMPLQREPIDLSAVCADELDLQRAAYPDAEIEYAVQGNTEGVFDASWMRQAIGNLVTNAIKHGDAGTAVSVKMDGDANRARVSVENAGDLPPDEIEQLFEPLRRGRSGSGTLDRSHLGLGLFIARQVTTAHGGTIKGSSSEGRVRFTIDVPKY